MPTECGAHRQQWQYSPVSDAEAGLWEHASTGAPPIDGVLKSNPDDFVFEELHCVNSYTCPGTSSGVGSLSAVCVDGAWR